METAQCKRILDLIVYLTCNGQLTTQQYADMLGVTRRNVYNYLKLLSDYGFRVVRTVVDIISTKDRLSLNN